MFLKLSARYFPLFGHVLLLRLMTKVQLSKYWSLLKIKPHPNTELPFPLYKQLPLGHLFPLFAEAVLCPWGQKPLPPPLSCSFSLLSLPLSPVFVPYSWSFVPLGQINVCAENLVLGCSLPTPGFLGLVFRRIFISLKTIVCIYKQKLFPSQVTRG